MWNLKGGRKPDPDRRRRCVEECRAVSLRQVLDGEAPPDLGPIDLAETRQRLGVRKWLVCPRCGRRCGKVYQPSPPEGWGCRLCLDLTYRSCREAHRAETFVGCLDWWEATVAAVGWEGAAELASLRHFEALMREEYRGLVERRREAAERGDPILVALREAVRAALAAPPAPASASGTDPEDRSGCTDPGELGPSTSSDS